MKIAFTSNGKDLDSIIDARFGRCEYILIYDDLSEEIEIIENNDSAADAHGAGPKTAHKLYNSNIDLVPIPTIRKETSEFQQTQNRMTSFMARKIVNLYGYNTKGQNYVKLDEIIKYYEENNIIFAESINFTNIVESFRIWLKKYHGQDLNFTYAERKLIQCTNLQKLLKDGKLFGYRILSDDEKKLDKENNYIN